MKRKVLVPLDGSKVAEQILPWVWALAYRLDLNVCLIQVLDSSLRGVNTSDPERERDPSRTASWSAAHNLTSIADDFRSAGIRTDTVVEFGETVESILATATRERADLIAMSTHGRSGIGRWLYGSIAEGVLHDAKVPVLMYRAQAIDIPDVTTMRDSRRVLVPLDGSSLSAQVLTEIPQLLAGADLEVTLFGVLDQPEPIIERNGVVVTYLDQRVETRSAEMQGYLTRQAESLRQQGIRTRTRIEVGRPAEWIVIAAQELQASFIAMATHARTGLDRITHGSVADQVLRNAQVPVLMVHGKPAIAEEAGTGSASSLKQR